MSLINPLGIQTTAGRPVPPRRRSIAGELAEYGGKTLMGLGAAAGTKLIEAGMGRGSALQDALVSDRVKAQQAEQQRLDKLTALSPAVVAQTQARAKIGAEAMAQGGQTERREMQEAGLLERLKLELADKERQDAFMNDLRSQQQVLNEWKTKRKGRGSGKRGRAIKNAERFSNDAFKYAGLARKAEANGQMGQAARYREMEFQNSALAIKWQAEAGLRQKGDGTFEVVPVEEPRGKTGGKTEAEIGKLNAQADQARANADESRARIAASGQSNPKATQLQNKIDNLNKALGALTGYQSKAERAKMLERVLKAQEELDNLPLGEAVPTDGTSNRVGTGSARNQGAIDGLVTPVNNPTTTPVMN